MILEFDVLLAQPIYPNISAVFVQVDHRPSCRKACLMRLSSPFRVYSKDLRLQALLAEGAYTVGTYERYSYVRLLVQDLVI